MFGVKQETPKKDPSKELLQQRLNKRRASIISSEDGDINDEERIRKWEKHREHKALKKEYGTFEEAYKVALMGAHQCRLDEIRIDQNDAMRAQILQQILSDIRKVYLPFKEDVHNEKELLFNQALDQKTKLVMVKKRKIFHDDLK